MPIRTYSPSATSGLGALGSKYAANITSSPLSVGNYKPLSSHSPITSLRSSTSNDSSKLSAGYGSGGSSISSSSLRRCSGLSSSSYSPSSSNSLHTGSYSSLSSTSSSSSSSISSYNNNNNSNADYSAGHYIPRGSFTGSSSRYSPASSTSAGSSALSGAKTSARSPALGSSSRYSLAKNDEDTFSTYPTHRTPLTTTRSSHYTPTANRYSATTLARRPSYTVSIVSEHLVFQTDTTSQEQSQVILLLLLLLRYEALHCITPLEPDQIHLFTKTKQSRKQLTGDFSV